MTSAKRCYFLGECMVELRNNGHTTLNQSFAGDTYNTATYLKRCFPDTDSAMITVIGNDILSQKMHNQFCDEALSTHFVFRHNNKVPGLYLIDNDASGERHFTYWRNDSAARHIMNFLSCTDEGQFSKIDTLFFSGISLAVIPERDRIRFWQWLKQIKSNGVRIAFDPNFRKPLWSDITKARQQMELAFAMSDVVLPGVEDLNALYEIPAADEAMAFLQTRDIQEIVIKDGAKSVLTSFHGETQVHPIVAAENVVDTTSAGDAFNGVYLGARMNNYSVTSAVQMASKAASVVIQYSGAIVPKNQWIKDMQLQMSHAAIS